MPPEAEANADIVEMVWTLGEVTRLLDIEAKKHGWDVCVSVTLSKGEVHEP